MTRMFCESLYQDYLAALIEGDRVRCAEMVRCLIDADAPLRFIYVDFLQRALYEIGELWERGKVSVATEHMATAITESMLSQCLSTFLGAEKKHRLAIVACPCNEQHQIGAKMVADFLEILGWDACLLGANTPTDALLDMTAKKNPQLLCLSSCLSSSLPCLVETVKRVRQNYPDLRIIVGGQAFAAVSPDSLTAFPGVVHASSVEDLEALLAN